MEPESKPQPPHPQQPPAPQPPPPPRELAPFVDDQGRLEQWPAKQKTQRLAAAYLAGKFEPGRTYNEREVNELLNQWHTFEDWALLRRVLFDWMFLDRESDGSRYRLRPVPPQSGSTSDPAPTSPA